MDEAPGDGQQQEGTHDQLQHGVDRKVFHQHVAGPQEQVVRHLDTESAGRQARDGLCDCRRCEGQFLYCQEDGKGHYQYVRRTVGEKQFHQFHRLSGDSRNRLEPEEGDAVAGNK